MARMVPDLSDSQLDRLSSKSFAEAKFYRACRDQLTSELLVVHSVPWIKTSPISRPRNGETDFAIFDPDGGFLVVEVKGGGVGFDRQDGTWYSIGRDGRHDLAESPFQQALREQKAMLGQIKAHPHWRSLHIEFLPAGHGVFLPDVDDVSEILKLPDVQPEIVGKRQDLEKLAAWLSNLAAFWDGTNPSSSKLGQGGMWLIDDLYCKPREVRPLLSTEIADSEVIRIKLTEEQSNRLRLLGRRRRAAIAGGAGTGKTMLAIERARELAQEGKETLLVCFNNLLGEQFRTLSRDVKHLTATNFHQLCAQRIGDAMLKSGTDWLEEAKSDRPGEDLFTTQYPVALWLANTDLEDRKFDAIIVDEAQDFRPNYWGALLESLKSEEDSLLYIFYDSNQRIFQRYAEFPIKDEPFVLTKNCRNTHEIHKCCYQYYEGEPTDPATENVGIPPKIIAAPSLQKQAASLTRHLVNLLVKETVTPETIVVLIADNLNKSAFYSELEGLKHLLPKPANWSFEVARRSGMVHVDTVQRFKGMESTVVYLWGIDHLDLETDRETLYVALSRAKDALFLVGTEATAARILTTRETST